MKIEKNYIDFIHDIKTSILKSRYQAAKFANKEMLLLYFNVGKQLSLKIQAEKWGTKVIQKVSDDLQNELPGLRGFSFTNLKKMRQFYEFYYFFEIRPLSTAQLTDDALFVLTPDNQKDISLPVFVETENFIDRFQSVSFTHHIAIINKTKTWEEINFYIEQTMQYQWSVSTLEYQIKSDLFNQRGKIQSNFKPTLPKEIYPLAINSFKDEYLLDFLKLDVDIEEREFEKAIIENLKNFILSLGPEYSFIANQHRIIIDEDEFFVDLLFFNRKIQSLIAIDLKRGKFKPEYAGKMNFYLNTLDEIVKLPHENNSIGIILCTEKKNAIVEYAFKNIESPMGVATYKFSNELPERLKKYLPDSESLKNQLLKRYL